MRRNPARYRRALLALALPALGALTQGGGYAANRPLLPCEA